VVDVGLFAKADYLDKIPGFRFGRRHTLGPKEGFRFGRQHTLGPKDRKLVAPSMRAGTRFSYNSEARRADTNRGAPSALWS
jgi:hypothetical protein